MASFPTKTSPKSMNHWKETSVRPNYSLQPEIDIKSSSFERNTKDQHNAINKANEHKCQVYVHQLNKIFNRSLNNQLESNWQCGSKMHQHLYKHELSDYYNSRAGMFRKQFDNLSLNSKNGQPNNPKRIPKVYHTQHIPEPQSLSYNHTEKNPHVKSNSNAKIKLLLNPQNKTVIDKLEERYWAKWKPNKNDNTKEAAHPKTKTHHATKPLQCTSPGSSTNIKIENESPLLKESSKEHDDSEQIIKKEVEVVKNNQEDDMEVKVTEMQVSNNVESSKPATIIEETESECPEMNLKHIDSFILTAKKQNREKPHYQQPKCIKLFKNVGYTSATPTIRIKGGTYPLKSCLKRSSSKGSNLGRPGSPVNLRKPGKANRFP